MFARHWLLQFYNCSHFAKTVIERERSSKGEEKEEERLLHTSVIYE